MKNDKYKIAVIVDNLNKGGIANAVFGFFRVTKDDVLVDFITYEKLDKNVEGKLQNCDVHIVKKFSQTNPIEFVFQFYRIFKAEKYQAVHIHTAFTIWLVALAAYLANIEHIVGHAHGSCYQGSNNALKLFIIKILSWLGRIFNKKLCTTMLSCAEASGMWVFGKKVKFCPNLLKTIPDNNEGKNKKNIKDEINVKNKIVIGFVGCFESQKNVELIPKIAKHFLSDENVIFVILGNGSRRNQLLDLIKETGTCKKIILLGYRNDSLRIMQCMDIVLAPSFSEGLSLTLLEAQLQGIPCLVSRNVPSTNDIGCNLIKYVDGYDDKIWANEIKKFNISTRNDIEPKIQLRKIGYDDDTVKNILLKAYGVV